ncbi:MAG: nucleotidyltransferase [Armatimonadota bacterium]
MAQAEHFVSVEHRDVYVQALESLAEHEVPFVLGGAFAVWFYTGRWRDTHDIDVFTTPENVPPAVDALTAAGFEDLGEQAEGDREWIHHAVKGDIIVDVIFKFANRVTTVADDWIERGKEGEFLGVSLKFMPVEELVHSKIFTMNKHRCDWPDIMRIFKANCTTFDWNRLLSMLGEHWLLFAGVIDVFDWQFPAESTCVPVEIRRELARRRLEYKPAPDSPSRENLLDPWIHSRPENKCYLEQ